MTIQNDSNQEIEFFSQIDDEDIEFLFESDTEEDTVQEYVNEVEVLEEEHISEEPELEIQIDIEEKKATKTKVSRRTLRHLGYI